MAQQCGFSARVHQGIFLMPFEIAADRVNPRSSEASDEPVVESRAAGTMETIEIGASGLTASRIALGTWAIGGWMWGGNSHLDESIRPVRSALSRGITPIATSPVYRFRPSMGACRYE